MVEWRSVARYEGLYEVSGDGRVRSLTRYKKERKPQKQASGYLYVKLYGNGTPRSYTVHKLVAQAFIGSSLFSQEIDHIDNNKENNNVENLQYVSKSQNQKIRYSRDKQTAWNKGIKTIYVRECPLCRCVFEAKRKKQIYCSVKCSSRVNGSKPKKCGVN